MSRTVRFLAKRLLAVVGAIALVAPAADAATISLDGITRLTAVGASTNLTTIGSTDWAYWNPTGSGLTAPVAPNNEKIGGAVISGLTNVGGATLRGSGSSTTVGRYTWTDGTPTVSGTDASLAGLIFNGDLGTSAAGKGLSFTLAGDTAATRYANLYFGGFQATGVLTLTLNGATTVIDSTQVFANNSPKELAVYSISYRPDSASDLLTVQYTATAVTDVTNGHIGAQAVTVSPVPEPGTISLAAVGAAFLLGRRRRSRGPVK